MTGIISSSVHWYWTWEVPVVLFLDSPQGILFLLVWVNTLVVVIEIEYHPKDNVTPYQVN